MKAHVILILVGVLYDNKGNLSTCDKSWIVLYDNKVNYSTCDKFWLVSCMI